MGEPGTAGRELPEETEMARVLRATRFASHKHRDQRRKGEGRIPYIHHPVEVAELVARDGGPVDTVVAALLHDTLEDTETTPEEIEEQFGSRVLGLVREVTDDGRLGKAERKREQVERAGSLSPEACRIRIADKICNLASLYQDPPHGWSHERKVEYFHWAREVVERARGACPELEARFDRVWKQGIERLTS